MHVVEFIRSKPDKKVLVFFPSCGGVKYFHTVGAFTYLSRLFLTQNTDVVQVAEVRSRYWYACLKNDHFTLFTVTLPRQNAQSR